jgi:hypothetical protein
LSLNLPAAYFSFQVQMFEINEEALFVQMLEHFAIFCTAVV